jgi:translocator protein
MSTTSRPVFGIAGWVAGVALALFLVQLGLNALWTWLFFAWHLGMWAFVEIVVLGLMILATIVAFGRIRTLAAWLLLPYLAWVSYATALTYAVWRLNPHLLR